jgi:glycosyltransferase involved in cell wall biosynthesis
MPEADVVGIPQHLSGTAAILLAGWNREATSGRGVTVVVCTYKRPHSVTRFLDSLEETEGSGYPVVLVDASPDTSTENAIKHWMAKRDSSGSLAYFRLNPAQRGLTKQRNFALEIVETDLVCFFDDDVELLSPCISEMERTFREAEGKLSGVGALIVNQPRRPGALWRLRRVLGIVANLKPGSYHGSGFSVPWGYVKDGDGVVIGDWLPGAAMLWNTSEARSARFCERFLNYSQSEDLEFSLRVGQKGQLAVTTRARVRHLEATGGRERHFPLGYMAIRNRYYIHRRRFRDCRFGYALWFGYAWLMDTAMLMRNFAVPRRIPGTVQHVAGRLAAACELLAGRRSG